MRSAKAPPEHLLCSGHCRSRLWDLASPPVDKPHLPIRPMSQTMSRTGNLGAAVGYDEAPKPPCNEL